MEIKGKVINVLPVQSGVSKAGKEWKKEDFILEVPGSPNNTKVCITMFGDKVGIVKKGETLTAHVDVESREYNGKWYTNVTATGVEKSKNSAPATEDDDTDGLPF